MAFLLLLGAVIGVSVWLLTQEYRKYDVVVVERGYGWHKEQVRAIRRMGCGIDQVWVLSTSDNSGTSTDPEFTYVKVTAEQVATDALAFEQAASGVTHTRPWIFFGDRTFPFRPFVAERLEYYAFRCLRNREEAELADPDGQTTLTDSSAPLTAVSSKDWSDVNRPSVSLGERWLWHRLSQRYVYTQSSLVGYWHSDVVVWPNSGDVTDNQAALKYVDTDSCRRSVFFTFHFPGTSGPGIGQGYTQVKLLVESEFD